MTDSDQLNLAMRYLNGNPLLHIDMLEGIRRGISELLDVSSLGVLLRCQPAGAFMISTDDAGTASRMLAGIPAADLFVAHQDFYIEEIQRRFGLQNTMPCRQAAYFQSEMLPAAAPGYEIRPLDASHLAFVHEHYSNIDDPDYLLELLEAGVFFGAYVQGRLAGFVGEHSEGSLGLLEVLPDYRRRGVAEALVRYATNRHLQRGYVPFSQIKVNNAASFALQKKLGYSISDETVCWLF